MDLTTVGIVIGAASLAAAILIARWQEKRRDRERTAIEQQEEERRQREKAALTKQMEVILTIPQDQLRYIERNINYDRIKSIDPKGREDLDYHIARLPPHVGAEVKEACRGLSCLGLCLLTVQRTCGCQLFRNCRT